MANSESGVTEVCATQAARPITVGGKTLLISPPRRGDWGKIVAYAQQRYMRTAKLTIVELGLTGDELRQFVERTQDIASRFTSTSRAVLDMLSDVDAAMYVAWLCVRWEQPELTYDEFVDLVSSDAGTVDEKAVNGIMDEIGEMVGLAKSKTTAKPSGKKPRPKPKRPAKKRKRA